MRGEKAPSDYCGEVRTGASAPHLRAAGIQPHPTSWLNPAGCQLSSGSITPISAVLFRYRRHRGNGAPLENIQICIYIYIFINVLLIINDEMQLCLHPTLGIYCTLHAPKFELIFQQNRSPLPTSNLVEMARSLKRSMNPNPNVGRMKLRISLLNQ